MANIHTKTELISLCLQFVLKKTHLKFWLCVKRGRATGENWPWRRRKPSTVPDFVWNFLNLLLQRVNGSLSSVLLVFSYPSGFGFMFWRNYSCINPCLHHSAKRAKKRSWSVWLSSEWTYTEGISSNYDFEKGDWKNYTVAALGILVWWSIGIGDSLNPN